MTSPAVNIADCHFEPFGKLRIDSARNLDSWFFMSLSGMVEIPRFRRREFCHAGAGWHPDPSSTWIPFFNGMTDIARHLDSRFRGKDGKEKVDFGPRWRRIRTARNFRTKRGLRYRAAALSSLLMPVAKCLLPSSSPPPCGSAPTVLARCRACRHGRCRAA